MMPADAFAGAELCDVCGLESCEEHLSPTGAPRKPTDGLDPALLVDAVDVIQEGRQIAKTGIRYTVDGIVPAYGILGMSVAFAKVGKTTLAQALRRGCGDGTAVPGP